MKLSKLIAAAAFGLLVGAGSVSAASAAELHPRVAEVNHRMAHQDVRIRHDLHQGRLTFAKAERLRDREHSIHRQEVRLVRHNHGHLTGTQTVRLNHEENRVGHNL